jgi:methylase of polypeptide subunit release factors
MNPEPVIKPGEIITRMGLAFETNDQVLVPRRETELLARTALELLNAAKTPPINVIDMCCGAGNLASALAAGYSRLGKRSHGCVRHARAEERCAARA